MVVCSLEPTLSYCDIRGEYNTMFGNVVITRDIWWYRAFDLNM